MQHFTWNVEREIFGIGMFALRWYSLLFAAGIFLGYLMVRNFMRAEGKDERLMDPLLLYVVVGTVAGARLGHCLFYEPETYLPDPIRILKIWEGGLASHGGYTGVIIALALFCWRHRGVSFFWLADRCSIPAMLAAACIRLGNFFNSEIVGRPADVPWAVIFAKVDDKARHPTQIYEAIGYFTVFLILYAFYRASNRKVPEGRILGLVMILAYSFRLFIEQFKENQVDFENTMTLNMGQWLSVPFILIGVGLFFGVQRHIPFLRAAFSDYVSSGDDEDGAGGSLEPATATAGGGNARRGQRRKQMRKAKK